MSENIVLHLSDDTAFSGLRRQLRAELRLPARPLEEHHHFPGDAERQLPAVILFDQRQRQVHTGGDPCRGVEVAILDIDAVRVYAGLRVILGKFRAGIPVRGDMPPIQQAGGGEHECSAAHRADTAH
ncbi:hypothetical protein D3C81_1571980 [compost metagenome]